MAARQARIPDEVQIFRQLMQESFDEFSVDLTFQNFKEELENLPGHYSPPQGGIILAFDKSLATGCVAFRPFAQEVCEMKRLYVRPDYRLKGHGRLLTKAVLDAARNAGYKEMYLDTMASTPQTVALYKSLGFIEIPPYYHNPHKNVTYLGLKLTKDSTCKV